MLLLFSVATPSRNNALMLVRSIVYATHLYHDATPIEWQCFAVASVYQLGPGVLGTRHNAKKKQQKDCRASCALG